MAGFPGLSGKQLLGRLAAVPGIGPWSAQVFMMRCLRRPDVFPASDLGIRAALMRLDELDVIPTPPEAARRAEPSSPFRSYAASYLWRLAASAANASETGKARVE